ncbi:hypothetical protein [Brevibacterium sp. CFH 10365]|uniref:hypothetical protein n=1 Tax=Brevibacterium sp. CFH 10365 TaxID=2585207 RepID=UPI001D0CEBB7|nr:hypothetical protein [Brevibacterium sp. CFH 10365]
MLPDSQSRRHARWFDTFERVNWTQIAAESCVPVRTLSRWAAKYCAIPTIVRITAGNFRLVDRLLPQIERMQTVNDLNELTPEVVRGSSAGSPYRPLNAARNVPFTAATHKWRLIAAWIGGFAVAQADCKLTLALYGGVMTFRAGDF